MDELYDIYDSEKNKIGVASWTDVHAKGLLHHTVAVLIFKDRTRQELLIHRRNPAVAQDPGLWQHSAGGHVVASETLQEAIRREVREELFVNHDLPQLEIREVLSFNNRDLPNNNEILHLFETVYPGPFYYDTIELAEEPLWVAFATLLEDVRQWPERYTQAFRNILSRYCSTRKQK